MTYIAQSAESTRTESSVRASRRITRGQSELTRIIRDMSDGNDIEECRNVILRTVDTAILAIANERRRA